jgi:hypothetical protein
MSRLAGRACFSWNSLCRQRGQPELVLFLIVLDVRAHPSSVITRLTKMPGAALLKARSKSI